MEFTDYKAALDHATKQSYECVILSKGEKFYVFAEWAYLHWRMSDRDQYVFITSVN